MRAYAQRQNNLNSTRFSSFAIKHAVQRQFPRVCLKSGVARAHLDGGAAVKAKRLGLPILQVHFQDIWHEQQRIVLHRVLETRDEWIQRLRSQKKSIQKFVS